MYCGRGGAEETLRVVLGRGYLLDGSEHHVDWTVWAVNAGESHEEAWQPGGSPSLVSRPEGMERLTRSRGAPRGRERGTDKTRTGQW